MKVLDQTLLEKVIIERSRTSHKGTMAVCCCLVGLILMVVPSSWLLWQLLKVALVW